MQNEIEKITGVNDATENLTLHWYISIYKKSEKGYDKLQITGKMQISFFLFEMINPQTFKYDHWFGIS